MLRKTYLILTCAIVLPSLANAEKINLKCSPKSTLITGNDTNNQKVVDVLGDLIWEYRIDSSTMDYCVTSYENGGKNKVEAGCFGPNSVKKIDKKQILIAEKEKDDSFSFEQYVNHKWLIDRKTLISTQTIDYLGWDGTKKGNATYVQKCTKKRA